MSKDICCGNCKHFKDEDAEGLGFCEIDNAIYGCRSGCLEDFKPINNGWTEITPDNVDEIRKVDVGRLIIAVITHGEVYYMEYREMFRELNDMAKIGGYYYMELPELKIE